MIWNIWRVYKHTDQLSILFTIYNMKKHSNISVKKVKVNDIPLDQCTYEYLISLFHMFPLLKYVQVYTNLKEIHKCNDDDVVKWMKEWMKWMMNKNVPIDFGILGGAGACLWVIGEVGILLEFCCGVETAVSAIVINKC